MKSRLPCAVYFILHLFDKYGTEMYSDSRDATSTVQHNPVYQSERWVVDNTYSTYYETFDIDEQYVKEGVQFQIELRTVNVTSENPLYFNGVILNEGEWDGYHTPNEVINEQKIGFNKSNYVNLYSSDKDAYLQVIRPNRDSITTNELTASSCTVLAPHLSSEPSWDEPVNLFLEFINQTEQRIDVLR